MFSHNKEGHRNQKRYPFPRYGGPDQKELYDKYQDINKDLFDPPVHPPPPPIPEGERDGFRLKLSSVPLNFYDERVLKEIFMRECHLEDADIVSFHLWSTNPRDKRCITHLGYGYANMRDEATYYQALQTGSFKIYIGAEEFVVHIQQAIKPLYHPSGSGSAPRSTQRRQR